MTKHKGGIFKGKFAEFHRDFVLPRKQSEAIMGLFRRKQKRCLYCGNIFYKTKKTNDHFEMTSEISPCCNDDFEEVKRPE
jgi:hypothetical protein